MWIRKTRGDSLTSAILHPSRSQNPVILIRVLAELCPPRTCDWTALRDQYFPAPSKLKQLNDQPFTGLLSARCTLSIHYFTKYCTISWSSSFVKFWSPSGSMLNPRWMRKLTISLATHRLIECLLYFRMTDYELVTSISILADTYRYSNLIVRHSFVHGHRFCLVSWFLC